MATKRISKEVLIGSEIIFDNQDDDENVAITPNYMSNQIDIISLDGLDGDPVIPSSGTYKIYVQTDEDGPYKTISKGSTVDAVLTGGSANDDGIFHESYHVGLPLKIKIVPVDVVGPVAYRVSIKQNSEQLSKIPDEFIDAFGGRSSMNVDLYNQAEVALLLETVLFKMRDQNDLIIDNLKLLNLRFEEAFSTSINIEDVEQ